jgi:hypothetical protein
MFVSVKRIKLPPRSARLTTPSDTAVSELKPAITFRTNVILPASERCLASNVNRFLAAGKPSPFTTIDEVPESLRPFVGEPAPMPIDPDLEAEEQMIRESFGPVNESVQEYLDRKQQEAADDAVALNAIKLKQVEREDEFFADVQREHDAETEALYEQQTSKRRL